MRIDVLFFAQVKEAAGTEREVVTVDDGTTVAELVRTLRGRPSWAVLSGLPLACAVNEVVVGEDHTLADNDVVALLPPLSGG